MARIPPASGPQAAPLSGGVPGPASPASTLGSPHEPLSASLTQQARPKSMSRTLGGVRAAFAHPRAAASDLASGSGSAARTPGAKFVEVEERTFPTCSPVLPLVVSLSDDSDSGEDVLTNEVARAQASEEAPDDPTAVPAEAEKPSLIVEPSPGSYAVGTPLLDPSTFKRRNARAGQQMLYAAVKMGQVDQQHLVALKSAKTKEARAEAMANLPDDVKRIAAQAARRRHGADRRAQAA